VSDDYSPPDAEEAARLQAEWDAKRAAARELAEATWVAERFAMQSSQPGMRMAISAELRQRDPAFANANQASLEGALNDVILPALLARSSEIVEIFVNLHARQLTVEHMKYAVEFYTSPVGRQLRILEPELHESMSLAVSAWISRTVGELIMQDRDALLRAAS